MPSITWVQAAQALTLPGLVLVALIAALTAFIKVLPQLRRVQMESDGSLRTDLMKMIAEQNVKIEAQGARISELERLLRQAEAEHSAIVSDLEHDLASEMQSFDSFLTMAETSPDKLLALVPKVREDRHRHRERMATKRGAREGAAMAVASGGKE